MRQTEANPKPVSVGMAVDSNVLIFERMREEPALGKSVKSSIDGGFSKAFLTIIDAHVTTLITALALFLFGTGPVKGFAVTLSLGIIFHLFNSIYYSHWNFNSLTSHKKIKRLNYMQFIKKPNLDYMKLRKFAFDLSGSLVILGVVAFGKILLGHANMGVDFAGGSLLQYKAGRDFSMNEVRSAFNKSALEGVDLQKVENENRLMVKIKKSSKVIGVELSEKVTSLLNSQLPDKKFFLESQTEIGSSLSAVLRNKSMLAIALSMGGVIVYLGFRLNLSFGIGAAVATFHDVLAVLGICWVMNIEMTLLMVINTSVNEVLSRSIVTSFTVFLSVLDLFIFGGSVIHDFSFALPLGVIIGTYSSIFVASPILTLWDKRCLCLDLARS